MHKSKVGSDVGSEPKKKLTDFFKKNKKNKNQHEEVTIQKNEELMVQNGKESITKEPDVGLPFGATPAISFSNFTSKELAKVHAEFSKMEDSDAPIAIQQLRLLVKVEKLHHQLGDEALNEQRDYRRPYDYKDEDEVKKDLSKVGKKLEEWKQFHMEREILNNFGRGRVIENKVATPPKLDNEVAAPSQVTK